MGKKIVEVTDANAAEDSSETNGVSVQSEDGLSSSEESSSKDKQEEMEARQSEEEIAKDASQSSTDDMQTKLEAASREANEHYDKYLQVE